MITEYFSEKIVAVLTNKRQPKEEGRLAPDLYYLDPVSNKYLSCGTLINIKKTEGFQVEVDFGGLPLAEKTFTISNSKVTTTSVITAEVSYLKPTGKDLDEIEMDSFQVKCGSGNGEFQMTVNTTDGSYLADRFVINYFLWL